MPVEKPTEGLYLGVHVFWFSRRQNIVTLPTSEAEYAVLGDAVKQLFLKRFGDSMLR